MNPRACLLVALLVSPAWSQEPVADAPVLTPKSFDLSNDSIKKIVRDTAATKYAYVQFSAKPANKPEPVTKIEFIPAAKAPPVKYPTRLPDPAPQSTGFLSTLIDVLLDVDDDFTEPGKDDLWLSCQARDDLKTARQQDPCASAYPKDLRPASLP